MELITFTTVGSVRPVHALASEMSHARRAAYVSELARLLESHVACVHCLKSRDAAHATRHVSATRQGVSAHSTTPSIPRLLLPRFHSSASCPRCHRIKCLSQNSQDLPLVASSHHVRIAQTRWPTCDTHRLAQLQPHMACAAHSPR